MGIRTEEEECSVRTEKKSVVIPKYRGRRERFSVG